MVLRKQVKRINLPMFLGLFLLCLTMISTYFTGGLYAKYSTSSSYGDGARVITFGELSLTESGDFYDDGKLMVIPGVDLKKQATVAFGGSEAAILVFAEVSLSSHWTTSNKTDYSCLIDGTSAMSFSVDGSWTPLTDFSDGSCVYYRSLEPGKDFSSDIIGNDGVFTVSDSITKKQISAISGVTVGFRAWAVQANGFDSPEAAWASLKTK